MANIPYSETGPRSAADTKTSNIEAKNSGLTQNQLEELQVWVLSRLLPATLALGAIAGLATKVF
jgi:hypothetical protein